MEVMRLLEPRAVGHDVVVHEVVALDQPLHYRISIDEVRPVGV
jgi:hypothetical protein